MKNSLLFTISVLLMNVALHSQMVYDWSYPFGSTGTDIGRCVTLEGSNTVISSGIFDGTFDFDATAGTSNLTNGGGASDMYIMKYNSNATFGWVVRITGTGVERPNNIINDGSGNVYICGRFSGTVDFDPGAGTTSKTSAGGDDIFLAKYTAAAGALSWVVALGSTGTDQGWGLNFSGSDLLLSGNFSSTVDFDPSGGTSNRTSAGGTDAFFAKFTTAGALTWVKSIGAAGNDVATCIADDGAGSNAIFVGGAIGANTVDMDPDAGTANVFPAGGIDLFVGKYTSAGAYTWAFRAGTTPDESVLDLAVYRTNVYVTGYITSGTVDFDPSGSTTSMTVSGTGTDAYIAQYSNAGGFTSLCPIAGTGPDVGENIESASGYIYGSGFFSNTVDFDPSGTTNNVTSNGNTDFYIARYDSVNNYKTANGFGSSTGNDDAPGLAINSSLKLVYLTGYFTGTSVDLDPGAGTTAYTSAGGNDIYLARYSWTSPLRLAGVQQINNFIYPNPTTGEFFLDNIEEGSVIEIYSMNGEKIITKENDSSERLTIDMSDFADGVYLLCKIYADGTMETEKFVLRH